jgi:hypothetical protein
MARPTLFGSLVAGLRFHRGEAILRALAEMPVTRIADARLGEPLEIVGEVRYLGAPLATPVTHKACAIHRTVVEQRGRWQRWRDIVDDTAGHDFLVDDGTGRARVRASQAFVALRRGAVVEEDAFEGRDEEVERFLGRHDLTRHGLLIEKVLRFRQALLVEGMEVAVSAAPGDEPDTDAGGYGDGYRGPPRRLVLMATAEAPLLIAAPPP